MTTLADMLKQKAELEKAIADTQARERSQALATIRELMQLHGLTASDLQATRRAAGPGNKGVKVEAKYRNAETGESWSGRGLMPKWLKAAVAAGKKTSDFAV